MGKFLKKIKDSAEGFVEARKRGISLNALAQSGMTLEAIYATFFYGIDGYISGAPSKTHRIAFKWWVVGAIDDAYNAPAKRQAKLISKKKIPSEEDIVFLKDELRPYFEHSLKEQLGKTCEMLAKVDDSVVRANYARSKKAKKGRFN